MKHSISISVAAAIVAAATGLGAAAAQQQPSATTRQAGKAALSGQDREFIEHAAQSGLAEVQASRMAVDKSQDPAVKDFAQKMIQDHTQANDKLAAIGKKAGADVPTEPSVLHKAKLELLKLRNGDGFDKQFVEDMGVDAHRDAIDAFQKEVREGRDPQLKSFAQGTLPKLQEHLKIAQDLKAKLDAHSAGAAARPASATR